MNLIIKSSVPELHELETIGRRLGPASIEEEEVNCHVVPYRIVFLQNIIFNMRCKIQIAKSENLISNSIVCMNCEILGWTI